MKYSLINLIHFVVLYTLYCNMYKTPDIIDKIIFTASYFDNNINIISKMFTSSFPWITSNHLRILSIIPSLLCLLCLFTSLCTMHILYLLFAINICFYFVFFIMIHHIEIKTYLLLLSKDHIDNMDLKNMMKYNENIKNMCSNVFFNVLVVFLSGSIFMEGYYNNSYYHRLIIVCNYFIIMIWNTSCNYNNNIYSIIYCSDFRLTPPLETEIKLKFSHEYNITYISDSEKYISICIFKIIFMICYMLCTSLFYYMNMNILSLYLEYLFIFFVVVMHMYFLMYHCDKIIFLHNHYQYHYCISIQIISFIICIICDFTLYSTCLLIIYTITYHNQYINLSKNLSKNIICELLVIKLLTVIFYSTIINNNIDIVNIIFDGICISMCINDFSSI